MILPLLKLGGQEQFWKYKAAFNQRYFPQKVTDVLGNHVVFERSSCWHVCFKPGEDENHSRAKRDAWSQLRAERIGWIGSALSDLSTEVRPNANDVNRLNYLLIVEPEGNGTQEYFVVVTEQMEAGFVRFITAFPADHKYWVTCRRAGKRLYPKPQPLNDKREEQIAPPA